MNQKLNKTIYPASVRDEMHEVLSKMVVEINRVLARKIKELISNPNKKEIGVAFDSKPYFDKAKPLNPTFLNGMLNVLIWASKSREVSEIVSKTDAKIKGSANKLDKIAYKRFKDDMKGKYNFDVSKGSIRQHSAILKGAVAENTLLIKGLAEEQLKSVQNEILKAMKKATPFEELSKRIQERTGVIQSKAEFIARDQTAKITSAVATDYYKQNGITKAIWEHGNSAKPRESHLEANGKEFNLDDGMYLDGEYIQPGELPNCSCTARPVFGGE